MRKKREWYKGATYHLMNRGISHQNIFLDDSDYEYFIILLQHIQKKYPFVIHAYCMMTNHYHLLLETKDDEIWKIMKLVGEHYTRYFNTKYGRDGALFRGRYHSILVESDEYFLQTSRYISLNPVKAGIVQAAEFYRWGSYPTFLGITDDHITEIEKTLKYFKNSDRLRYRNFIEEETKYIDYEKEIQKQMREDDLWLPW